MASLSYPDVGRARPIRAWLRRARHAMGRVTPLTRARTRLASLLILPWEWPTLFGVEAAAYYPRFHRGHDNEALAAEDLRKVIGYTMTKYDRCVVLHNLVKHVEDHSIDGAFVECGVWRGGSAGIMALANLRYGRARRPLYLFDTWGRFPDPGEEDVEQYEPLHRSTLRVADNTQSFEACRRLLEEEIGYPTDALHYVQGLFEETLPPRKDSMEPIAILRLDCDWYASVRTCLETLFPRLVPGGVLIIDDYGYCSGAKRAVDEYLERSDVDSYLHYVDYSCRYLVKDLDRSGGRMEG